MRQTKKTSSVKAVEEVMTNNFKAGLFVGLDKKDISQEAQGTMLGSSDQIALALFTIAMGDNNQIFAKSLRDALFKAVAQIMIVDDVKTREFSKMLTTLIEKYNEQE